uniref:Uncharacterized protein n=1 Tax=Knipowitschia caucasica TaxID=637954 RepID=A0AAV2JTN7_KNICA
MYGSFWLSPLKVGNRSHIARCMMRNCPAKSVPRCVSEKQREKQLAGWRGAADAVYRLGLTAKKCSPSTPSHPAHSRLSG